jgi:predicted RNase H-like nuclease (RuvC/YqgF family)
MGGFIYKHTCPDIDKGLNQFRKDLESRLEDLINECCPLLDGRPLIDLIERHVDAIHSDFSVNFENVRETNEDMREEAESQINNLEIEITDIKEESESQINDLETKIKDLEAEVYMLESEISQLNG